MVYTRLYVFLKLNSIKYIYLHVIELYYYNQKEIILKLNSIKYNCLHFIELYYLTNNK